jgi:hypothetical protein
MISAYPIQTELNNGILSSQKAMPQKSITSANDSTFSMNRHAYIEGYNNQTTNLVKNDQHSIKQGTVNNTQFGFKGFSNINHNITGQASTVQKKWIGGNRDASTIISKRRVNSVGNGSLNASGGQISFTTVRDINVTNNALRKVRAGGAYVPPPKCRDIPSSTDPRKYIF